jgi:RNA polymerase sigma-70 factor (ECF subfamily)
MNVLPTTHWSAVLNAGHGSTQSATRALEQICQTYWYPIYAYARALGNSPEDAADLTQTFFGFVLQRVTAVADPEKGSFRAFLKSSLRNLHLDRVRQAQTCRRGRHAHIMSIDEAQAEQRYSIEPLDHSTPDRLLDRLWWITLLDMALVRLRDEFIAADKGDLFDLLKHQLQSDRGEYAKLAETLGSTEGALRVQVTRMRRRLQDLLIELARETVVDPNQARAELDELRKSLRAA